MVKLLFDDCCHRCEKRYVGCHSTCETYINAKREYAEKVELNRKIKQADKTVNDTLFQGVMRKKKGKRK